MIAEDGRAGIASARAARAPGRTQPEPQPPEEPHEDVLELSDPVSDQDGLLSPDTAVASRQSLATLAALRQQNEASAGPVDQGPLEAIVREMLRPMLKQWLDDRLPEMVEEMVAREIARITGRGI